MLWGGVRDELIDKLGVTKEEGRLLWRWAPWMKCLNNDEASLPWLVIRKALLVGKRLFVARLAILLKCVWFGDMKESIAHAFFHCPCVSFLKAT